MEACVMMAKEYMKKAGITDLKLAKRAINSLVGFARLGAEIGVAGEMYKPDLETVLAIQKGLNKLNKIESGRTSPRKLFMPPWSDSKRKDWDELPGKERRQCSRCRHVVESGERLKKKTEGCSVTTLCPRCKCDSYYAFKYEVTK